MNKFLIRVWVLTTIVSLSVISDIKESYAGAADINKIGENIILSITGWPNFIAALSYLCGLALGVLGVLKIRTHVEKPDNVPLAQGLIRLFLGGAFLSMPMFYEIMKTTIDGGMAVMDVTGPQLTTSCFKC